MKDRGQEKMVGHDQVRTAQDCTLASVLEKCRV